MLDCTIWFLLTISCLLSYQLFKLPWLPFGTAIHFDPAIYYQEKNPPYYLKWAQRATYFSFFTLFILLFIRHTFFIEPCINCTGRTATRIGLYLKIGSMIVAFLVSLPLYAIFNKLSEKIKEQVAVILSGICTIILTILIPKVLLAYAEILCDLLWILNLAKDSINNLP